MPHAITLTGPSGCGKSTAIKYFMRLASDRFRPHVIAKYSTRKKRTDDGVEIKAGLKRLPQECDLVYEQYGDRYGLVLRDIFDAFERNEDPIVILNDVRTVEDMRNAVGGLVRSIFIFRGDPDKKSFEALASERGSTDSEDITRRFQKSQAIYRIYIENIHIFDHVILNRFGRRELGMQVKRIVAGMKMEGYWPLKAGRKR